MLLEIFNGYLIWKTFKENDQIFIEGSSIEYQT
jgi:hypothetical protein